MKSIQWRHTDWRAHQFVFQSGKEMIGRLVLISSWNVNASYSYGESKITFVDKSFFGSTAYVKDSEGAVVATLNVSLFSHPQLKLASGESYTLRSFLGRNGRWMNVKGEIVAQYKQATLSTMGHGTIHLLQPLSVDIEQLLTSSGLYISHLMIKRALIPIAFIIPIIAASNHRFFS